MFALVGLFDAATRLPAPDSQIEFTSTLTIRILHNRIMRIDIKAMPHFFTSCITFLKALNIFDVHESEDDQK
jgi:hypothetical protein